ncbi:hypothetical protein C8R44DRAFT_888610 [Mycena epipterygia]|nr:hypothetical protein C8R44DRAFT_888610 [Mycena epipterygia]
MFVPHASLLPLHRPCPPAPAPLPCVLAAPTPLSPAIALPAAPPLATLRPLRFPGAAVTGPAPFNGTYLAPPQCFSTPWPPFTRYSDFRRPGARCSVLAPLPRCGSPRAPRSPTIPISAAPALAGLRPPRFPGAAATGPTLSSVTQFTSPLRFSVQHPPFARYPDFRRPGTCCPAPVPLPQCGCYWTHT